MAYMHRETFEITRAYDSDNADDYFEADDMIAPVIRVLNRKGYVTEFCCSGHPFRDVSGKFSYSSCIGFKEGISLPSLPPGYTEVGKLVKISLQSSSVQSERDGFNILETELKRWKIGSTQVFGVTLTEDMIGPAPHPVIIERRYNDDGARDINDVYGLYRDILEAMEQLYQWALGLSERKD